MGGLDETVAPVDAGVECVPAEEVAGAWPLVAALPFGEDLGREERGCNDPVRRAGGRAVCVEFEEAEDAAEDVEGDGEGAREGERSAPFSADFGSDTSPNETAAVRRDIKVRSCVASTAVMRCWGVSISKWTIE